MVCRHVFYLPLNLTNHVPVFLSLQGVGGGAPPPAGGYPGQVRTRNMLKPYLS